jgi:hypothetical protein
LILLKVPTLFMKKYSIWLIIIVTFYSCVHDPEFSVEELPSNLIYSPDSLSLEVGNKASSVMPTLSGSEPYTFNISSIPNNEGNITIDQNGVINVNDSLALGDYLITVIVINSKGSVSFADIFKVRIYEKAQPPSQMVYAPKSIGVLTGNSYSSNAPNLSGTAPFTFALIGNPAPGKISINNQGIVTTTQALSNGSYSLDIEVSNSVSSVTFISALTINVSNTVIPPTNLVYSINSMNINEGTVGNSVIPGVWGSSPFTFTLSTIPDAGNDITIGNTGVISTTSNLAIGTYKVSVMVSNSAGAMNFSDIYNIIVNEVIIVTFTNDIKPIISNFCDNCHTQGPQTIYTEYVNASSNIDLILNRVQRTPGTPGFMPKTGSALSSSQIQLLKDWFDQGLQQ